MKKLARKISAVMLSLMILLSSGASLMASLPEGPQAIEERLGNKNVEIIQEVKGERTTDAGVKISVDWSLKEEDKAWMVADDYYEFSLPDVLKWDSHAVAVDNELDDVKRVEDKVRLTFTEEMLSRDEVKGSFLLTGTLDETLAGNEESTVISFDDIKSEDFIVEIPGVKKEESFSAVENENVSDSAPASISSFDTLWNSSISRFEVYTTPEKTTYLSGEEVLFFTGLSLTEESGVLRDLILEVKIPKANLTGTPIASDISSQLGKTITQDADFYIVRYELSPLAAGVSIDVPIKFTTHNGNTPDGFKIPIEANLLESDGTVLSGPVGEEFTITTQKPVATKYANYNGTWTGTNNYTLIDAGKEDPDKPGYLSEDLADLKSVSFSYGLVANSSASYPGNRYYEEFVFEDVLPEGAVFVAADNPGWTYDEITRVATYTYRPTNPINLSAYTFTNVVNLNLKFPGAQVNKEFVNEADITSKPQNMASYETLTISSDDIKFRLKATTPVEAPKTFGIYKSLSPYIYYDYPSNKTGQQRWTTYVRNLATVADHPDLNLEKVEMTDRTLDSNLKFVGVEFIARNTNTFVGTVDVIVNYVGGSSETIASDLDLTTAKTLNFSGDVESFTVKFTEGSYLLPGAYFYMYPLTEFKDPDQKILPEGQTASRNLYNYLDAKGSYTNGTTYSGTTSSYISLRPINQQLGFTKALRNAKANYFIHDKVDYRLTAVTYGMLPDGEQVVEMNSIVDFLPAGMEYVPGSASLYIYTGTIDTQMTSGKIEPQVFPNYKGSGQTALVWDLEPFTMKSKTISTSSTAFYLDYQTTITKLANQGINTNNAWLSWENNDVIKPYSNSAKDIYDLNNNGSTEDNLIRVPQNINYVPPRELIVKKEVKGSLDSSFMSPPGTGLSEIGDEVDYQLTLFNNSVTDIMTVFLVDLFPKEGDVTVSTDIMVDPPERVGRGSTFALNLRGPVTAPDGFKVFYTQDVPGEDMNEFTREANWVDSLDDYEKATALKLELLPGNVFRSGEIKVIDVPMSVPNDTHLTDEDQAVNSFGIAITNGLNFVESNMSTVKVVKYNVHGYVFDDFNQNGFFNEDVDHPFANYLVQLVDASGNVVNDLDGNPYEIYTDEDGFYTMDVYRQGNYRIKVLTPEGFEVTQMEEGPLGSSILDGETEMTGVFRLDPNNREAEKNAGYYRDSVTLTIRKVLENALGEIIDKDVDFDFTLTIDDSFYEGEATVYSNGGEDSREVTITEGKLTIKPSEYIVIEGLEKDATFKVEEDGSDDYLVTPEGGVIEGDLDESFVEISFVNRIVVQKIEFIATKEWVNGPSEHPTIELQLFRDGDAYGDPVTLESGTATHTWKNLDKTDENGNIYTYTVDEVTDLEDYTKEVDGNVITNTYVIPKTEFTVTKEWVNGPNEHPTIELQLFRDGDAYGDPVTLESGTTTYTWEDLDKTDINGHVYAYTVDEVSELKNYVKKVEGNIITNTYVNEGDQPSEKEDGRNKILLRIPKTGGGLWGVSGLLSLGGGVLTLLVMKKRVK